MSETTPAPQLMVGLIFSRLALIVVSPSEPVSVPEPEAAPEPQPFLNKPKDAEPFIQRPLLRVPRSSPVDGTVLKIMTYNTLAQALVSRSQFPDSGAAVKWGVRSKVLLAEIAAYNPDILCLQEVDADKYPSFWTRGLASLGYQLEFFCPGDKKHGVMIAYKKATFRCRLLKTVSFDDEHTENNPLSKTTNNVAGLVFLQFEPHVKRKRDGVVVATTHLHWHPFASYERTRQMLVLLRLVKAFEGEVETLDGNKTFYLFMAGDLNTQPTDAAYVSMTQKPVKFREMARNSLAKSLQYDWSRGDPATAGNPNPVNFKVSPETAERISQIEEYHNSLELRAISLYSLAYHLVHPENAGLDNDRNEPPFSNWAHAWVGLLDYICVISDWWGEERYGIGSLQDITNETGVELIGLLRLPTEAEMGNPPLGLPQKNMYPSDHLCMLAEVNLT